MKELGKEIESFYLQRLSKFNGRIEELEKIIKSSKGDKDELEIELIRKEYNIEKNRFINYVMNPRTVEKIYRKAQEKEKELEGLFNEKITKATYISIIIFNEMFKWKEIDISDFDRIFSNDVRGVNDDRIYVNCEGIDLFLYDLFSYYEKKYKKSEIRAISTVNFPLLDIIKAKSEVEELKISKIYIMQKNIEIYASTILDYSDSKLKEYFQKMKEKILFDFSLFSSDLNIDYNYFVKLDRNDWLEGNSSIIHEFTKKNELRLIFQEDEANFKINRLEKAILEESTFAFYKIYGIKRQSNSSINRFWELEEIIFDLGIGVIQEKGNEDIIIQENARLICEDIEARIEKNETNDDLFLANEYLKYFLVIYKHYYSINYLGETKEEVHINKNLDELKKIRNQIEEKEKIRKEKKENREFRKIEELEKEMEELEKEIVYLIKEEIYKREFNNIKFKETMQDIINIDKITPILYNYRIGDKGIKEIYFQYVKEKKIEENKDFENALNRIKYKHVIN